MDPESTEKPLPSRVGRRAMLAGAAASVAALGAQAILPAGAARAGGGAVILGQSNIADAETTGITRNGASLAAFAAPDYGVLGSSILADGAGVVGSASKARGKGVSGAVSGDSGIAVSATSTGKSSQIAVHANATFGPGEGYAVKAETKNGIALYGSATGGYALQVDGVAVFRRSGKATLSTGQASRTISHSAIVSDTLILATIQGYAAGVWVAGVVLNIAAQTFTIRLNKAAPKALQVGWFIVN